LSELSFTFYIDCNLIPANGTWFLQQTWFINQVQIVTSTPIQSNLTYPLLQPLLVQQPFQGSYGQSGVQMVFVYTNAGTALLTMDFTFEDVSSCINTGYHVTDLSFQVGGSIPSGTYTSMAQNQSFFNATTTIAPGEYLYIQETIDIVGCVVPCLTGVNLTWHCANMPPNSCIQCNPVLSTVFSFDVEIPTFEMTRITPSFLGANFDNSCPGTNYPWTVQVTNTSAFATIQSINVNVIENDANSFTIIANNVPAPDLTSCTGCSILNYSETQFTAVVCTTQIPNPVQNFTHVVGEIPPGGSFTFSFNTIKCCDENSQFLNVNKSFNHWRVNATGTSPCIPAIINSIIAANDPIEWVAPDAISSHHTTPTTDIDLNCSIIPNVNSMVIDPDVESDAMRCDNRYSLYKNDYQVKISNLIGDINDLQVLGYDGSSTGEMKMILRVEISTLKGLLIEDGENEVFISNVNNSSVWNQIPYSFHTNNSEDCCLINSNYTFYFDISSVTGTVQQLINDFFENGILNFKFQACCDADPTTEYTIEFSVLLDKTCAGFTTQTNAAPTCISGTCCFLPLSSTGNVIHVHCPGCKSPGAIVDYYYLQRTSFGLEDDNDDHIADNATIIDANYNSFDKINRKGAVFGDIIEDRMVGHFQEGDASSGGYTYNTMLIGNSMVFNALQVHKAIKVIDPLNLGTAGPTPIALEPIEIAFYVDEPVISGANCPTCNEFDYSNSSSITTASFIINSGNSNFNNFYDITSTVSEKMFIFKVTDIISQMDPGSTFTAFSENQQYRIAIKYRVCGNFQSNQTALANQDLIDRIRNTEFNNTLFFNGDGIPLSVFENPVTQAPNTISELMGDNLQFPGIDCTPIPCPIVNQTNFANANLFYCEKFSANFDFYSTTCYNTSDYENLPGTCEKQVKMIASVGIGGAARNNLFPYEYKPPGIFPYHYEFTIPTDLTLVPNLNPLNTLNIFSSVIGPYSNGQPTYQTSGMVPVSYSTNGPTISLDFQSSPSINCVTGLINSNTTNLFIGDEGYSQQINILLEPINCDIVPPPTNGHYPESDSKITFTNNQSSCLSPVTTCTYFDERFNQSAARNFREQNPNLQISFSDNGIANATTNQVCWHFDITNLPVSPPATPPFTEAVNLFIAIPEIATLQNWNDWTLNYNVQQNVPNSATAGSSSANTNGIFNIAPFLLNHSVAYINGDLCKSYVCSANVSPIEFNWGWNCDGFPVAITNDICGVETMSLFINQVDAEINGYLSSSSASNYTLCDNFNITTCFNSTAEGTVRPDQIELVNFPSSGLALVSDPQINNCSLTGTPAPLTGSNYTWNISGTELAGVGIGNNNDGIMHINDCFCLSFEFEAKCGFNGVLPSFVLHSQTYCSDSDNDLHSPLDVLPLNQSGTNCTDCFLVTKTIEPFVSSVASGTEPVTYHIEVCAYNVSTASIDVWDVFPTGPSTTFTPIGTNPFGAGGAVNAVQCTTSTGTDCCNYYVTGTITSSNTDECNDAFIGDALNPSPPDGSAQACVAILNNCLDSHTDFPVNQTNPTGASNATSVFGCSGCNVANKTIDVAGTLVIDANFTFTDCIFYMEPASEIILLPYITANFARTSLSACTKMWKGITLDNNSMLTFRDVDIQGAQYAIHPTSLNNIVVVSRSNFVSNYIGIYVPFDAAQPSSSNNNSIIYVAQSKFFGTGSLPPAYAAQADLYGNQPVTLATIPLAGIHISKLSNLFIGQDPLTFQPNEFTNMSTGIIGWRSNLTKIVNCKFVDINAQPSYANVTNLASFGNSYNGSAIYGNGYKSSFAINQEGFGNAATDPASFINCDHGIFADQISLISHNNKMQNVGTGYRAQLVKSGVNIYENSIDAREDGVQLLLCDGGGSKNEVWNNKILFGNNNYTSGTFGGIVVQEDLNQNVYSRIHNNDIYFGSNATARYGIFANSTVPFEITRNRISLANNSNDWDGIFMSNNLKSNISCNVISAAGNLPSVDTDPSAIKFFMGDGPSISCNHMDNTPNGIFVIGQIQPTPNNLRIMGNEFNSHFVGLRYGVNTIADNQDLMGNLWFNNAPNGGFQAKHDLSTLNINQYFNLVHLINPLPPGSSTYFPTHSPSNWFKQSLSPTDFNESCDLPVPDYYCNENFPEVNLSISELDMKIAADSIENDPYTDETKWIMKKGLFTKIFNNPSLLSNNLMAAFYSSMQNTFIAQLREIEEGKSVLFLKDSTLILTLDQMIMYLETERQLLQVQLDLLADALENNYSTASIHSSIVAILTNLHAATSIIDSLEASNEAARLVNVESVRNSNNQLYASAVIEENEKVVNEISLATIGKSNYVLNVSQIAQLRAIAEQCPLAGGSAVFRARALLYLIDGRLYYNDRQICWNEGIALKELPNEKAFLSNVKLYPNPANEKVTLEYKFEGVEKLYFTLYNAMGVSVMEHSLNASKNSFVFSTEFLTPGVYHVRLGDHNEHLFNGKLVIIR
jgi:hypothetical protein